MGLFDFLSSSPEKKANKAKQVMLNEHHQHQVRQQAIYDLGQLDDEHALHALIERLGVNFRDTIKNEKERGWVRHLLVEQFNERAIEPLKSFIQGAASSNQSISGAAQVLGELISEDEFVAFLIETLNQLLPSDHRTVDLRQQLIDALEEREEHGAQVVEALLPYVVDHSDDIRIKVINIVEERLRGVDGDHRPIISSLIQAMTDPFASGRTARAAAQALIRMKAQLSPFADELDGQVPEGYVLKKGYLVEG